MVSVGRLVGQGPNRVCSPGSTKGHPPPVVLDRRVLVSTPVQARVGTPRWRPCRIGSPDGRSTTKDGPTRTRGCAVVRSTEPGTTPGHQHRRNARLGSPGIASRGRPGPTSCHNPLHPNLWEFATHELTRPWYYA